MAELEPLPQEMRALGVDDFLHHLPVESIQVTDRHGPREYAVPDAAQEAATAPLAAPEPEGGVVTPLWAESAPEGHEAPGGGLVTSTHPVHETEVSSVPMFRQPQSNVSEVTRDMHMKHVHVSIDGETRHVVVEDDQGVWAKKITFNQPHEVPPSNPPAVSVTESTDLTLEERVEWLEEEVGRLGRRLQSTLDANNLWDGS